MIGRLALLVGALLLCCALALAEPALQVPEEIHGFGENEIVFTADTAGEGALWLLDEFGRCRLLHEGDWQTGENHVLWDGLGANEEELPQNGFSLEAVWRDSAGREKTLTVPVLAGRSLEAVVYALPLSDDFYLEDPWWVEMAVTRPGQVRVEVLDGAGESVGSFTRETRGYTAPIKLKWDGRLKRQQLPPGAYTLRIWSEATPGWVRTVQVTLHEGTAPQAPIQLRDDILPVDGATDEEIWALMRRSATVVDLKNTSHQLIFAEKSRHSKSLGTLRGQSQALRVLEDDGDGWVKIGAWEHEAITYVEGYVQRERLKTVTPQGHYGLLVNKSTQTMTVYKDGARIGTLPVSTGIIVGRRIDRETTPGLFFTQEHMSDYSTNGHKYDYVIRYDGGNLLHQLAYHTSRTVRNFAEQMAVFGEKASHGCIRLPSHPSAEGGINAYWLWTHIPFGTPVVVIGE